MIVIGVDVHKQSVTAVAVDEAGRMLDERTVVVGSDELVGWASALGAERLWALEDCRLLTPWLERQLLVGLGEELVRVSPKLTVPERRAGRVRGKSDPIDALAVARAALREPALPRPQPGEGCIARSSCWSIIVMISLTSGGERSSGCAGICTSSTRPSWFPCGDSIVRVSSSASAAGWRVASRTSRCGLRVSSSATVAR